MKESNAPTDPVNLVKQCSVQAYDYTFDYTCYYTRSS